MKFVSWIKNINLCFYLYTLMCVSTVYSTQKEDNKIKHPLLHQCSPVLYSVSGCWMCSSKGYKPRNHKRVCSVDSTIFSKECNVHFVVFPTATTTALTCSVLDSNSLELATGQSQGSSWYDTALELQLSWVRIPPEYSCLRLIHRAQESTEYTVLTHIGV